MNKLLISHIDKYTKHNKYLKHYLLLCKKGIERATTKKEAQAKIGYVETHHIIPTSFNPSLSKKRWNKVHLSAREHFVAHKLLIHASNDKYKNKAKYTISRFLQSNKLQKRILSNRDYQYIREIIQETMSGSTNPMYGKNGTLTGKKCITNGTDNKFISKSDKVPVGWEYGMTRPNIVITNGIEETRIYDKSNIPDGWYIGSKRKGNGSPLKGRTLGSYDKSRVTKQKKAINNLQFSFYTNGKEDIKIPKGDPIPSGFKKGRTFGGHQITEDMINRSLTSFNVKSLQDLKESLTYDLKNNINTITKIKNKYKKKKSICKNNDPKIEYFIDKFNLNHLIVKGKPGPKPSS